MHENYRQKTTKTDKEKRPANRAQIVQSIDFIMCRAKSRKQVSYITY